MRERLDVDDLDFLAQMMALATGYIEEQDEPEDAVNIPRMEEIIQTLHELQAYEISEDESPEDEEMASAEQRAADDDAPPDDRAGDYSHPIRGRREETRVPLYTGGKEVPRWRL